MKNFLSRSLVFLLLLFQTSWVFGANSVDVPKFVVAYVKTVGSLIPFSVSFSSSQTGTEATISFNTIIHHDYQIQNSSSVFNPINVKTIINADGSRQAIRIPLTNPASRAFKVYDLNRPSKQDIDQFLSGFQINLADGEVSSQDSQNLMALEIGSEYLSVIPSMYQIDRVLTTTGGRADFEKFFNIPVSNQKMDSVAYVKMLFYILVDPTYAQLNQLSQAAALHTSLIGSTEYKNAFQNLFGISVPDAFNIPAGTPQGDAIGIVRRRIFSLVAQPSFHVNQIVAAAALLNSLRSGGAGTVPNPAQQFHTFYGLDIPPIGISPNEKVVAQLLEVVRVDPYINEFLPKLSRAVNLLTALRNASAEVRANFRKEYGLRIPGDGSRGDYKEDHIVYEFYGPEAPKKKSVYANSLNSDSLLYSLTFTPDGTPNNLVVESGVDLKLASMASRIDVKSGAKVSLSDSLSLEEMAFFSSKVFPHQDLRAQLLEIISRENQNIVTAAGNNTLTINAPANVSLTLAEGPTYSGIYDSRLKLAFFVLPPNVTGSTVTYTIKLSEGLKFVSMEKNVINSIGSSELQNTQTKIYDPQGNLIESFDAHYANPALNPAEAKEMWHYHYDMIGGVALVTSSILIIFGGKNHVLFDRIIKMDKTYFAWDTDHNVQESVHIVHDYAERRVHISHFVRYPSVSLDGLINLAPLDSASLDQDRTARQLNPESIPTYIPSNTPDSDPYDVIHALDSISDAFYVDRVIGMLNNSSPTISPIADQTLPQNAEASQIPFTIADAETDPGSLSVTGFSSNTDLISDDNIVFSGSGADRTVTVIPAEGQFGTANITIDVFDGMEQAQATFTVIVTPLDVDPGHLLYVSVNGSNGGDGSPASPLRTIQAAIDIARAGDTVLVQPGVYREEVSMYYSGTEEAPITVKSAVPHAAIIEGSELLTGNWERCPSAAACGGNPNYQNIYFQSVPSGFTFQEGVFEDDRLMPYAQFPDAGDLSHFDELETMTNIPKFSNSELGVSQTNTSITDPRYFISDDPNYYAGGYVAVWVQPNIVAVVKIVSYNPATHTIIHDSVVSNSSPGIYTDRDTYYRILNLPVLINRPGEYAVDELNKRLYLRSIDGAPPSTHQYNIQATQTGISIFINRRNIVIDGFQMRMMRSAVIAADDTRNIVIRNLDVHDLISSGGYSIAVGGWNNVIENNTVARTGFSVGILAKGNNVTVQGNTVIASNRVGIWFMSVNGGRLLGNNVSQIFSPHANSISLYTTDDVLVAENHVSANSAQVTLGGNHRSAFVNNIFESGMTCWADCSDNQVYNNVILDHVSMNNYDPAIQDGHQLIFRNNILGGFATAPASLRSHNIYTAIAAGGYQQSPYWSPSAGEIIHVVSGSGSNAVYAGVNKALVFANPQSGDGLLSSTSLAINAGANLTHEFNAIMIKFPGYNPFIDASGKNHGFDGSWDIGAFEFVSPLNLAASKTASALSPAMTQVTVRNLRARVSSRSIKRNAKGDVNGDGYVTKEDAFLVAQQAVGLYPPELKQPENSDVSGNGEVTTFDAALILQYTKGLKTFSSNDLNRVENAFSSGKL